MVRMLMIDLIGYTDLPAFYRSIPMTPVATLLKEERQMVAMVGTPAAQEQQQMFVVLIA
jgi:hypothetical protein